MPKKGEADIIQRIFGSLRVFVGDWAFIKAEEYHHRGLPFEEAINYHHGETFSFGTDHHEHDAEHEARSPWESKAGIYSNLYSQVKVTADSHLKPEEEKEVLPWFYIEVAFNPHGIRGYVLGSYWLERIGKNKEAIQFLKSGETNNPDSAQILTAMGELYFKKENYEDAKSYLERACQLWIEAKGPNVAVTRYSDSDRMFAFDLLASIYTKEKNYGRAMDIYTELLKFGQNPVILEKVKKLQMDMKGAL